MLQLPWVNSNLSPQYCWRKSALILAGGSGPGWGFLYGHAANPASSWGQTAPTPSCCCPVSSTHTHSPPFSTPVLTYLLQWVSRKVHAFLPAHLGLMMLFFLWHIICIMCTVPLVQALNNRIGPLMHFASSVFGRDVLKGAIEARALHSQRWAFLISPWESPFSSFIKPLNGNLSLWNMKSHMERYSGRRAKIVWIGITKAFCIDFSWWLKVILLCFHSGYGACHCY